MKLFNISSNKGKSHCIIIPKEIVKGFGWVSGQMLKHRITGKGTIEISLDEEGKKDGRD